MDELKMSYKTSMQKRFLLDVCFIRIHSEQGKIN